MDYFFFLSFFHYGLLGISYTPYAVSLPSSTDFRFRSLLFLAQALFLLASDDPYGPFNPFSFPSYYGRVCCTRINLTSFLCLFPLARRDLVSGWQLSVPSWFSTLFLRKGPISTMNIPFYLVDLKLPLNSSIPLAYAFLFWKDCLSEGTADCIVVVYASREVPCMTVSFPPVFSPRWLIAFVLRGVEGPFMKWDQSVL